MPALDVRLQAKGGPQVDFTGTVDSGATRTALSIEAAEELWLGAGDLREAGKVIIANEREVACWSAAVEIRGAVHSPSFPGGPGEPWGPIIEFKPIFLETGSPLWGQADFCKSFEITLQRYKDPASFILNHWAGMSLAAASSALGHD